MAQIHSYAVVDSSTGEVVNTIIWDGESPWAPPEGCEAIQSDVASTGWSFVDGVFSAPPDPVSTQAEVLSENQYLQSSLLRSASQSMTPVLFSLQLGDATEAETALAKEWQSYYRALQSVDLTQSVPDWPSPPSAN